jgi:L-ribulokinase
MFTLASQIALREVRMMAVDAYVVGIDFGTDSVRALVVDAANGKTVGVAVEHYPRWAKGLYCDALANRFRQHPLDYLESMEAAVKGALAQAGGKVAAKVRGIAVDTTGSTPVLADGQGRPLALTPAFAENPNAMFVLWKDHTSLAEAEQINRVAHSWPQGDYTKFTGGLYSAEWFWAKVLHVLETDAEVGKAAVTVLEHCDWIPAVLTGTTDLTRFKRSRCAAGHKALWHAQFGGYPSDEFLAHLHPRLPKLKASFGKETFTSDHPFGVISPVWATQLGLPPETVVAVGAFDAHMGAVGGGIGPHRLLKVIGTSTCDMLVAPKTAAPETLVPGICGQVDGSILPDAIGYEAGQSAFGDVYAWFKNLLAWPLTAIVPSLNTGNKTTAALIDATMERIIPELEKQAQAIAPEDSALIALDWMNGRRTPDANHHLKGAIVGIALGTDAPRVFRGLVEATAFGSRAIVTRFRSAGVRIDSVIAIGGVATKSAMAMQVLADVLNLEVVVPAGDQSVALGAAMFAATAAGLYPRVEEAQRAMSATAHELYRPNPVHTKVYERLYDDYVRLGAFVEGELMRRAGVLGGAESIQTDNTRRAS